jgi:RHS repeat-associated protein
VAEISSGGGWARGYVYLGSQLLAIQSGGVYWMHSDPIAKSEIVTNSSKGVVSAIELDPWGGETSRMTNSSFQSRWYTSYERDENGSYDAMSRRYNRWWSRFEQADPWDGSYNLADPQSFNRNSYAQNDPVNFTDPSGLCTFRVLISGVTGNVLKGIQDEMKRIFETGGQEVVFDNSKPADGGTMNLSFVTSWPADVEAAMWAEVKRRGENVDPRPAFGFTPNAGIGARNAYVNMPNIDSATFGGIGVSASSPTKYGRVGAHEVIQHGFLNTGPESSAGDVTSSAVSNLLRRSETDRFNISKETAALLNKLCPPKKPAQPSRRPRGGGRGGGRNIVGAYLGYDVSSTSMGRFVDWISPVWRGRIWIG